MVSDNAPDLTYCADLVEQDAVDLSLSLRMAGPALRDRVLPFAAFVVELIRVPASVSESMLGQIRQQWWCEAVPEMTSEKPPRAHPVIAAAASSAGQMRQAQAVPDACAAAVETLSPFIAAGEHDLNDPVRLATDLWRPVAAVGVASLSPDDLNALERPAGTVSHIATGLGLWFLAMTLASPVVEGRPSPTGEVATFSRRLHARHREDSLLPVLQTARAEIAPSLRVLPVPLVPLALPTALVTHYLRCVERGQDSATPFAAFRRRARLLTTTLTGRF